jgi:hypothetical protein
MVSTRQLLLGTTVVSFLAGSLTSAALVAAQNRQAQDRPTQPPPPAVVQVNFMKVPPGRDQEYVRTEQEIWKPVHQERIRRGQMRSWTLYARQYPGGDAAEYNYVTVDVYDSFADVDRDMTDLFARVLPKVPLDSIGARTEHARSLVRNEVWRRLDSAQ